METNSEPILVPVKPEPNGGSEHALLDLRSQFLEPDQRRIILDDRVQPNVDTRRPQKPAKKVIEFSEDQLSVIKKVSEGKNVFLTGSGGCGKTFLICNLVKFLRSMGINVAITAYTGIASDTINQTLRTIPQFPKLASPPVRKGFGRIPSCRTLHSWAGVGLDGLDYNSIVRSIRKSQDDKTVDSAWNRWRNTELLIVDEVSMLPIEFLNILNSVGKEIRNSFEPFGGIQLIFVGDFMQLTSKEDTNNKNFDWKRNSNTRVMQNFKTIQKPIDSKVDIRSTDLELKEQFRIQSLKLKSGARGLNKEEQEELTKLQKDIRVHSQAIVNPNLLEDRKFVFETDLWKRTFPLENIVLLTTNFRQKGDKAYQEILEDMRDGVLTEKSKQLLQQRVGVKLKNKINGYTPLRLFARRKKVDEFNKAMFSVTLPSKQKVTYKRRTLLFGDVKFTDRGVPELLQKLLKELPVPEPTFVLKVGLTVVLLKNLDLENGLVNGARGVIVGFTEPKHQLKDKDPIPLPIVHFAGHDSPTEIPLFVWKARVPDSKPVFHLDDSDDTDERFPKRRKIKVVRKEVGYGGFPPLKLRYASTIHKCQSQSLDAASIHLEPYDIFDYGLVYTALSRVSSLEGLKLEVPLPENLGVHPKVIQLYTDIEKYRESLQIFE